MEPKGRFDSLQLDRGSGVQRIVSFPSRDGFRVNALLVAPSTEAEVLERPVVLQVHGVLGHFLARGTPRTIPPSLLPHGISTLSINTRMAFMGQIFGTGIFDDTVYDIEASVRYLEGEGFRNIFILGYSLGANMVVNYMTGEKRPSVKGVILEGCSFSLPDSQRGRYHKWGSIPSYEEIYFNAKRILGPDPRRSRADRVFIVYRAWGDTFNPSHTELFTYKTWWFCRSPEAEKAKTYKLIDRVGVPVLLLQGEDDYIVDGWEPKVLARIARRGGNDDVTLRYIPGARHDCMENPPRTVKEIVGWLARFGGVG